MEPETIRRLPEVVKDDQAIREVISKVKSQGLFDQFRKECIADVDTKPAYHNLLQRVETFVEHFLREQKWRSVPNKNQLRENLRRQLNNSGMMHNGVERIIEQVVNPKILLGIKPKIDEAVCDHLGLDLKERQEELQKKKQERQRLLVQQQQQIQQQNLQSKINQDVKPGENFDLANNQSPFRNMAPWGPGMANFPTPSVQGVGNPMTGMPGNPQCMMNFPGVMQPLSMMGGWTPGFNPAMQPMIPGQPMIPAFPGAGVPPAALGVSPFGANISPAPGSLANSTPPCPAPPTSAPGIPDLSKPPPGLPSTPLSSSATTNRSPVIPPGTTPIAPAPPGSVPPPPGTVPVVPPSSSSLIPPGTSPVVSSVPTTPTIPALISHTLAKVSEEKLTPEKIAVFKTAAAFITKTVSNAQSLPGADLATMFSPRVLAEAMMEESGKPLSKHEIRAAKRKERMKEIERLRAVREIEEKEGKSSAQVEDKEDPLPPKHNLMDVFQGAEDVSDDEEALDMLMDVEEPEDKNKTGIILSDESDKEGDDQPPTSQPGKRYNFAWDVDINPDELSDVTISSIHTSDMSSFEEDLSSDESDHEEEYEKQNTEIVEGVDVSVSPENNDISKEDAEPMTVDVNETVNKSFEETEEEEPKEKEEVPQAENAVQVEESAVDSLPVVPDSKPVPLSPPKVSPSKPRKLLALSSHYSDSDDDETREERKARIAKEKEERYLKRQQRRAELEAKRKEREEEKARLKEEKKKQKELMSETKPADVLASTPASSESLNAEVEQMAASSAEQESQSQTTPKKRKNKAELKEQLLQQKVMERKAALRRRRTRNRRYASDEFTSIFSERKTLSQSYNDDVINSEELVTFDGAVEVVEMTVDQECVVETVSEEVEITEEKGQKSHPSELVLQCPSPYSDISDRSMSDKSDELANADNVSIDKVSSEEEELGDDFEDAKIVEETTESVKGEEQASVSHIALESEGTFLQNVDSSSAGISEPVSPRSRVSTQSKSVVSQDDLEKTSSILDEKSSVKSTGTFQIEEDKESYCSMNEGLLSPAKTTDLEYAPVAIPDETESQNSDMKAASPKDIMADLELEPVSDEDSSLGALSDMEKEPDKEEGEEKDSDIEMANVSQSHAKEKLAMPQKDEGIIEDDNASDEGEIKSDSEEERVTISQPHAPIKEESSPPRVIVKRPIEFVDFGEAEKRARGSRVFYSETERRRAASQATSGYRGGYSWQSSMGPSINTYTPSTNRYVQDTTSPIRSKSPGAAFEVESEASSHSRSSIRVRDDVPPPYPIEGISRMHKSSASSSQGSAVPHKPVSLPSPVSSSSSSRSRHSIPKSRSRSRSQFSSRSSSSDSSASRASSRKRKRSERKRKRKRRSSKSKDGTPSVRSNSPSSRMSFTDRLSPSHRTPEASMPGVSSVNPQSRQGYLSSGNESISSDELPYFPDDEAEKPSNPSKVKQRSVSGESSSSSHSKHPDSPGAASISSSELIYSPTRKRPQKEDSDDSLETVQKIESSKYPKKSSSRHSASSDDEALSPREEANLVYSPHRPSSPPLYPLVPDDMSGFQPPLPQESPDHPPLPCNEQPPLPPLPPDEPLPYEKPLPPDEIEEGECPSSPEYEEHLPERQRTEHESRIEHEVSTFAHPGKDDHERANDNGAISNISTALDGSENISSLENDMCSSSVSSFSVQDSSICQSVNTDLCSFQSSDSKVKDLKDSDQIDHGFQSRRSSADHFDLINRIPVAEASKMFSNDDSGMKEENETQDNLAEASDHSAGNDFRDKESSSPSQDILMSETNKELPADVTVKDSSAIQLSTNEEATCIQESDPSKSRNSKRPAEDIDGHSDSSPPSKRQREMEEGEQGD